LRSRVVQSSRFAFADPTGSSNTASSTSNAFSLYTKSSDVNHQWGGRGSVVGGGHPFFVAFVWGSGPAP
jgi:hypothetical protein